MTSFVYFIQRNDGGPIKIGLSRNPQSRFAALQTASDAPLRLIATMEGDRHTEKQLHARFSSARLHGEWFSPTEEIHQFVRSLFPASEPGPCVVGDGLDLASLQVTARARFHDDASAFCKFLQETLPPTAFDKVMALTAKAMLMGGA